MIADALLVVCCALALAALGIAAGVWLRSTPMQLRRLAQDLTDAYEQARVAINRAREDRDAAVVAQERLAERVQNLLDDVERKRAQTAASAAKVRRHALQQNPQSDPEQRPDPSDPDAIERWLASREGRAGAEH